jgi:hypothetical protein
MKIVQSRLFKLTSILATLTFTWTMILAPTLASAAIVPQSESDIGAINTIGASAGLIAYGSGSYVKYSDGVQALGEINLNSEVLKLVQSGDTRTYAVTKDGVFHVIDNSNVSSPVVKGTYQLPAGNCTDLDKHDANTIVVMNDKKELSRVDVTNETSPTCLSQAGMGTQFESANGTAVVNDNGEVSKLNTAKGTWTKGTPLSTAATDISIDPDGSKVYTGGPSNQVQAFSLVGAVPVLLATFAIAFGSFFSLVASATSGQVWICYDEFGSLYFVLLALAAGVFSEVVSNAWFFKGKTPRLAVDPSDPTRLFVAMASTALVLLFSGGTLSLLHTFTGAAFIHQVALFGILGVLYMFAMASYSGVHIYNMANPVLPVFLIALIISYAARAIAFHSTGAALTGGGPAATAAAGPYGVIATSELGFELYNFQTPATPTKEDGLFTGGLAHDVAISGNVAYGADDGMGLQIIDISTVTDIAIIKTVPTPGPATRVHVEAGHAYVAASFAGVRIIDIGTPASASEVGSITSLTDVTSITSDGTYLYFGKGNTLHIYDLVSPAAPAFVGSHTMPVGSTAEAIAIVDVPAPARGLAATKYAYVAAGLGGFVVVDVSTPAAPTEAHIVPSEFASAIAVDGRDVYLGDGATGFVVHEVDPQNVPVFFQDITVRVHNRGVDLTWDFIADETVVGVDIFRTLGGNALPVRVNHEPLTPDQRTYRDDRVTAGETYEYTVVARTASGYLYTSPSATVDIPMREMTLFPNYPNPFNPSTTISFDLPQPGHATVAIYDAMGRLVVTLVDQFLQAGVNDVAWDGTNARGDYVGSGVYLAKVKANHNVLTQKLTLLK